MTDLPFYARYPAVQAGETIGLSRDQCGGYDLLMDAYWLLGGKLPDEDPQLAQITRCRDLDEWQKLRSVLQRFFKISGGFWKHIGLAQQRERAGKLHEARRTGGHKTASKLWKHKRKLNDSSATSPAYSRATSSAYSSDGAEHHAQHIAGQGETKTYKDIKRKEEASLREAKKKAARLDGEPAPVNQSPPSEKQNGAGRGERLPLDWQPDDEDCRYARERGLDPAEQANAFRDVWNAKVGINARKLDWSAAWRTWCRREVASRHRSSTGSQRPAGDRPGITSFTSALRRAFPDVN